MKQAAEKTAVMLKEFFASESAGGIVLMFTALAAIIIANSPWSIFYDLLLTTPVEVFVGDFGIAKPLLLWINDGLMAIFFFHVGLELKREMLEGELSDPANVVLPAIGAVGGMAIPALIYVVMNLEHPETIQGWAIPAATDIAFALGILSLLGKNVPLALKLFLASLAIFDDIGAIVIIAIFYTSQISQTSLTVALCCLPILFLLNRNNVSSTSYYVLIGLIMWGALLKSGVHATLAGVVLALFIPLQSNDDKNYSPLKTLEHDLHGTVAFFILPVFAFANAGLNLSGIGLEQLMHPVPLGIAAGLFIGKQVGVFGFCFVAIKLGLAQLPKNVSWTALYGVAALCGVGFTMSLFIGSLAFETTGGIFQFDDRLGIIVGSLLSGIFGYLVLKSQYKKNATAVEK
ncbi:Na+/H+ antiporter NhaA [Gayadomonas joobiniege]|uniref:Na+/H+ antiporter NhaA n=1 Tax=Gayadomonas joobiniege TaxID=1234606 RepID=UPI00036785DB|nr:Na+/H+ antiporter NhaA [Gayadomonas joobiniege]